ncbi:Uncharacterised protein [Mycobacteroides abscessus subsp. abscessus]|nr:Uncharacterised protein [Mycobacteroides abscessus subsp. abscessus]
MSRRDLGFQGHDLSGGISMVAVAVYQREHRGDMRAVRIPGSRVLLLAVVGLVGQAQPGLADV